MYDSWQGPQADHHSVIGPVLTSHDMERPTPSLPHGYILKHGMQQSWPLDDVVTRTHHVLLSPAAEQPDRCSDSKPISDSPLSRHLLPKELRLPTVLSAIISVLHEGLAKSGIAEAVVYWIPVH